MIYCYMFGKKIEVTIYWIWAGDQNSLPPVGAEEKSSPCGLHLSYAETLMRLEILYLLTIIVTD